MSQNSPPGPAEAGPGEHDVANCSIAGLRITLRDGSGVREVLNQIARQAAGAVDPDLLVGRQGQHGQRLSEQSPPGDGHRMILRSG